MTREEAIKFLGQYIGNDCYTEKCQEAHRMAISALRAPTREQVGKVWKGEWILELVGEYKHLKEYHCSECGYQLPLNPTKIPIFCENCGSPLTDEAVEIVMERINEMEGTENGLG